MIVYNDVINIYMCILVITYVILLDRTLSILGKDLGGRAHIFVRMA